MSLNEDRRRWFRPPIRPVVRPSDRHRVSMQTWGRPCRRRVGSHRATNKVWPPASGLVRSKCALPAFAACPRCVRCRPACRSEARPGSLPRHTPDASLMAFEAANLPEGIRLPDANHRIVTPLRQSTAHWDSSPRIGSGHGGPRPVSTPLVILVPREKAAHPTRRQRTGDRPETS